MQTRDSKAPFWARHSRLSPRSFRPKAVSQWKGLAVAVTLGDRWQGLMGKFIHVGHCHSLRAQLCLRLWRDTSPCFLFVLNPWRAGLWLSWALWSVRHRGCYTCNDHINQVEIAFCFPGESKKEQYKTALNRISRAGLKRTHQHPTGFIPNRKKLHFQ